uniref:Sperm-associated antigen 16 protein-like n=1 Tax=Neolamprologus brichardi TaxID=32507 RepID=A0A3Q4G7T0_NEOBR
MLLSFHRERLQSSTDPTPAQVKEERRKEKPPAKTTAHLKDSEFPPCSGLPRAYLEQMNSHTGKSFASFSLACSTRAHQQPISCIDLHPRKLILVSASDDSTWRLWVGEMLLTGEGHSDWLSGCSFHPDGSKLATTSGDTTVRLWDFSRGCCVLMLSGHAQPTWACSFHSCGHFLASCSADRTAKLWDLNSQRCRLTLRQHTASVNSVCFLPSSNLLLTCSADKTIALWDARLGVCTTTFLGHYHPCNHAAFSSATSMVASCDSSGIVNTWDTRKPTSPMAAGDTGPLSANQVAFNHSGKMLAVASSDGLVKLVEVDSGSVSSLEGHRDSVQSVTFDHKGETVISAGSDGRVNIWS